jgi:hypothetical protein
VRFSRARWLKNRRHRKAVSRETAEADAEAAAAIAATAAMTVRELRRDLLQQLRRKQPLLLRKEVTINHVNAESS